MLRHRVAQLTEFLSAEFKKMATGATSKTKGNYKGRSPNVLRYVKSCGSGSQVSSLLASNLVAGARLAAKNESQALDEKTGRTNELRLIALEKFAAENGDDAVLFGENKRPFLAATVQTFMREFFVSLAY